MNGTDDNLEEEVRYYSPGLMRLNGIITAIGVVATVGVIIYGATVDQVRPSLSNRLLGIGIMMTLGAPVVAFGFGAVRSGVLVHRDGITVRNVWRSHRVAWEAIERFSVQPFAHSTTGRVHLRNGEVLTAWGIQAPNRFIFPNSAEASEPIARLNALLQQHRSPADDH